MAFGRRYYGRGRSFATRQPEAVPVDVRIEFPSRGTTYCRDEYGVYSYGEYPPSSVLAGQQRRTFLDSFPTLEEAQAKYPQADVTGCGFMPPNLSHLPGDEG